MEEILLSKLKNKIIFADLKLHDIPNTCVSTIKAIKRFKNKLFDYSYQFRIASS